MIPTIQKWSRLCQVLAVLAWPNHGSAELPLKIPIPETTGLYSPDQWKRDWPGCPFEGGVEDGRVSIVKHHGAPWLRVHFAPGEIGPTKGGAGWRMPFGKHETAELSYQLRLGNDFDFVKGGKLPGLCGGPDNVSGGRRADGTNGFSARLMWRRDGRGEAYVYHKNQKTDYGDSFAFPASFRFPTDTTVTVRLFVAMNTPGKRDGILRVWIDRQQMVDETGMEWRSGNDFGVDSLYFEAFHGGGDHSWAPRRACFADFSHFLVTERHGGDND